MKMVGPPVNSIELEKYRTYNTSLRSKSDLNLNPQPEGHVKLTSNLPENRSGIYAIQTDRGNLYPTVGTQINMKGEQTFQNRLQDTVKPTTKETLLHTYEGYVNTAVKNQTEYSQFIPTYVKVDNNVVRASGASNYSLRSGTEYSHVAGPSTTGASNNVMQDPDVVYNNVWKRADNNVDGPGTFKGVTPDSTRTQIYNRINEPETNGMRLTYNLEANESQVLGVKLPGVEERYTAAYQIAPLLTNPLHKIWNPDNRGELPAFWTNSNPADFSYIHQTRLPEDEYIPAGFNTTWAPDSTKTSSNAYILGLQNGVHNDKLEWRQSVNNKPATVYDNNSVNPGKSYGTNVSIKDLYPFANRNQETFSENQNGYLNNVYTTLGSPNAGYINY